MRLWPRVFAAFVAVVAGALLLKAVHPLLVLAVFIVGTVYAFRWLRQPRLPADRETGAELLGLKREAEDPFGILGYPLALFSRMKETAIGGLVWGPWRSMEVHAFDVSFLSPSLGGGSQGRSTFSCAMARLDGTAPALVVEPQAFVVLLEQPPAAPRVETGDPAFDGSMAAWSEDADAARALLDESARGWLRLLEPRWGVEVRGRIALVYGPAPEHPDVVASLGILRELVARTSSRGALRPADPGMAEPAAD